MKAWKQRLLEDLEPILRLPDPRPQISAYHNMPYAIFIYRPEDEFTVRNECSLLRTRLERAGKRITVLSLAECLGEAIESAGLTPERIAKAEQAAGTEKMIDTIHAVLRRKPLEELLIQQVPSDANPLRDIVFIVRAGSLFPFYRTSSILEQLEGRIQLPSVLFYPGVLEGAVGLSFMGVLEPEHNYRPKIF